MAKQLLLPHQPRAKSVAGAFAFSIQKTLGLRGEIVFSRLPLFQVAFSRLRDVMVSETLGLLYFPIPKSACTMFATLVALHEHESRDYDPMREGVHDYRFRTDRLRLKKANYLANTDYFKFTVVRDPYTRLLSAYLDKLVKPLRTMTEEEIKTVSGSFPGNLTFEALVQMIEKMPDYAVEKHWRSQYTFFRNVTLDYVGCFERLDHARTIIDRFFHIDLQRDVEPKVLSTKRTNYSTMQDSGSGSSYLGNIPPSQLAQMKAFPKSERFYNDELKAIVEKRYARDFAVHRLAIETIDSGGTILESCP